MPRIKELDYLRGLAALGIMCYHYMKWLYVYEGANSFIGRVSVYGVEIFYIISGITLYHVYHQKLTRNKGPILAYFLKRFFRIFPLFWLSILLTLLITLKHTSLQNLLLNVSGLFSIVSWDTYISPGTWSVGNELVFYLVFPFLLYLHQLNGIIYALVGLILFILYHYFAFYIFNPNDTLHNQWSLFINPLNHLLLFYIGMSIPILFRKEKTTNKNFTFLILFGAIILFDIPTGDDGIYLLYGINRWLFTIASAFICIGFYCLEMNLPKWLDQPFKQLGEMSYAVYLLHPFFYQLICNAIRKAAQLGYNFPHSNSLLILIAVLFTLLMSKFIYHYFEVYFIKKGTTYISNFYKS